MNNSWLGNLIVAPYISGPMTGIAEFNMPAFRRAKEILERYGVDSAIIPGADEDLTLTPSNELSLDFITYYAGVLKYDAQSVLRCRSIILLDDWIKSRGARLEILVGCMLNRPMFELDLVTEKINLIAEDTIRQSVTFQNIMEIFRIRENKMNDQDKKLFEKLAQHWPTAETPLSSDAFQYLVTIIFRTDDPVYWHSILDLMPWDSVRALLEFVVLIFSPDDYYRVLVGVE